MPDREDQVITGRSLGELYHSLGLRLFLWLFGLMILVFAGYAYVTIRGTSRHWRQMLYQGANRTSELIKRATHYGMLLNRKDDVHHIIRMIAEGPGVVGIRIYDKRGTIIFSADSSEIGQRVDLRAEACIICHDTAVPLQSVPTLNRVRVYRGPEGERTFGLINPIENQPECANAACHAHPPDQTILGVLDVKMSMAYADNSLRATERQMLIATLLMALIIGAASAIFIYRVVRVPVKRLIEGTHRIARGDLETRIDIEAKDEIGELAAAFNRMTEDLRRARQEITEWSQKLEQKVVEKTEELSRAQRQIIHMEKMASLGKLAATVAHELNNPLAGILTYAKLIARELDSSELTPEERKELARYLTLIQKESSRCGAIVRNLLLFARRSGAEFALHHLNQIIERALMLVRHHLEMVGIRLEEHLLAGDDQIVCDADQMQQALIALLVNAVEAMPDGGTLTVKAHEVDHQIEIEVSDTGVGVPAEALPHIFEPFFSTKEEGNGVGLGLAVVYGIVQRHGGAIEVDSEPGKGSTFRLRLPRRPEQTAMGAERDSRTAS